MKKIRSIVCCSVLLLSQWVVAVNLTSADPYWVGGASSFGTTEGNDYWVTFPNNNFQSQDISGLQVSGLVVHGLGS